MVLDPSRQDKRFGATRVEPNADGSFLSKHADGDKPVGEASHAALRATLSADGTAGGPVGDWVVYSGASNSWRGPFAMEAIYPRPDAETATNELHRKAHGSVTYRVPLDIRGGRWPFKGVINSGPAGATIGSEMTRTTDPGTGLIVHEPGSEYLVVTWDPSGHTGAFSFDVTITDQAGSTLNMVWSGERDDSAFVFVDSVNGNDANSGTVSSKLQTFPSGLWKNSDEDTTFAGKIAVFDGTVDIHSGTAPSAPIVDTTKKPLAYISTSGATFNTSTGNFRTGSGPSSGVTFQGVSFDGSRTDLGNNRIIFVSRKIERFTVQECSFDNITVGSAGTDNPGCVVFFSPGSDTYHEYISVSRNTIGSGCEVQLVVTFNTHHHSASLNSGSNLSIAALPDENGAFVIHPKDDTSYVTVRGNVFSGFSARTFISFSNQDTETVTPTDQECCYNRLVFDGNQGVDAAIEWNTQANASASNMRDYANSVSSTDSSYRISSSDIEQVLQTGCLYAGGFSQSGQVDGSPASVELTTSDFDSAGKLTGSARTTHLGALGAEIAGEAT